MTWKLVLISGANQANVSHRQDDGYTMQDVDGFSPKGRTDMGEPSQRLRFNLLGHSMVIAADRERNGLDRRVSSRPSSSLW